MTAPSDSGILTLSPIGVITTSMHRKFDAPHQPDQEQVQQSVINLFPGHGYDRALRDLEGFDWIWLVWWFHRNPNWRPMVRPPRGQTTRKGVFATRSPHRPNPIGLTAVRLISVENLRITIGASDLVDGTPILDIKPYLRTVDSIPHASLGWLEEVEKASQEPAQYTVHSAPLAATQLGWLREVWGIDFVTRATSLLERDPTPNKTRRIARCKDDRFRMGCGAWRLFFSVVGTEVTLDFVTPGYPARLLTDEQSRVPDKEAQLAFTLKWGAEAG